MKKYCIKLINYNTLTEIFFESDFQKEEFEYYFTHAMSYPIWYIADNFERIMRMRGVKYFNFTSSVKKVLNEDELYKSICCGKTDKESVFKNSLDNETECYFLFDVNNKEDEDSLPYILISKIDKKEDKIDIKTVVQNYGKSQQILLYKTIDKSVVQIVEETNELLISNTELTRMLKLLFSIDKINNLEEIRRE